MYSLNVPVPGRVRRLAAELRPSLAGFEEIRERHTLVLKRLGDGPVDRALSRARRVLAGAEPVEARIAGIGRFETPLSGPGPVCYLAVEGEGLFDLHNRLVSEFGAVPGFEGEGYVPHVTLARGGGPSEGLLEREVEPVAWTVGELACHDARRRERVGTIRLG